MCGLHASCVTVVACVVMVFTMLVPFDRRKRPRTESDASSAHSPDTDDVAHNDLLPPQPVRRPRPNESRGGNGDEDEWGQFVIIDVY